MCAYGAGELLLHEKKSEKLKESNRSLYDILSEAKEKNKQILEMVPKIESPELKKNIKEIYQTVNKIISTIEKKTEKYKQVGNFFDYYLPTTLNILTRYDEIENQSLSTSDSTKFMKKTENMLVKINSAFKNQLSNLYQSDIVDTDAEIKVFDAMLKADGYDTENDFKKERDE